LYQSGTQNTSGYSNGSYNYQDTSNGTITDSAHGSGYSSSDTLVQDSNTSLYASGSNSASSAATYSYQTSGGSGTLTNSSTPTAPSAPTSAFVQWSAPDANLVPTVGADQQTSSVGVKQHVLVDSNSIPLAAHSTPANVPEIKELLSLVDTSGPRKPNGEPKHHPKRIYGDRAYDSEPHREELRKRGITPKLAKRNADHGSGLGKYRWVVERLISWLHGFRKLRFVTKKEDEMPFAFLNLAICMICLRFLNTS
jgi:hypothetical protein